MASRLKKDRWRSSTFWPFSNRFHVGLSEGYSKECMLRITTRERHEREAANMDLFLPVIGPMHGYPDILPRTLDASKYLCIENVQNHAEARKDERGIAYIMRRFATLSSAGRMLSHSDGVVPITRYLIPRSPFFLITSVSLPVHLVAIACGRSIITSAGEGNASSNSVN